MFFIFPICSFKQSRDNVFDDRKCPISPNFTFSQGSEKTGRRSFAERSRCIKARLRRASFSISRACFSIASSHTPNTSAIFRCSASARNGYLIGNDMFIVYLRNG